MKLLVEISDEKYNFIIERYKEDKGLQTRENLYKTIATGQPLPEDCEILTKEAYEDLCMRANYV